MINELKRITEENNIVDVKEFAYGLSNYDKFQKPKNKKKSRDIPLGIEKEALLFSNSFSDKELVIVNDETFYYGTEKELAKYFYSKIRMHLDFHQQKNNWNNHILEERKKLEDFFKSDTPKLIDLENIEFGFRKSIVGVIFDDIEDLKNMINNTRPSLYNLYKKIKKSNEILEEKKK